MYKYKGRIVKDMRMDDVDLQDYPDFCDAHICSATWADTGNSLTDQELIGLNEDCPELIQKLVWALH